MNWSFFLTPAGVLVSVLATWYFSRNSGAGTAVVTPNTTANAPANAVFAPGSPTSPASPGQVPINVLELISNGLPQSPFGHRIPAVSQAAVNRPVSVVPGPGGARRRYNTPNRAAVASGGAKSAGSGSGPGGGCNCGGGCGQKCAGNSGCKGAQIDGRGNCYAASPQQAAAKMFPPAAIPHYYVQTSQAARGFQDAADQAAFDAEMDNGGVPAAAGSGW